MASRTHPIFMNFNSGEISPKLEGRLDLTRYHNGAKEMTNVICLPQGGFQNRGGFHFAAKAKFANKLARLLPFQYAELQNYICEFGNEYIRFYMNEGRIYGPDPSTKLLLHMNGADASTTFEDDGYTGHTVTPVSNAKIDTEQSKFGGSSGIFGGYTDYLSVPDHADWAFGSDAFTIDFWMMANSLSLDFGWFIQYETPNMIELVYNHSNHKIYFLIIGGGSTQVELMYDWSALTTGVWHHMAVVRGWGGDINKWAVTIDGEAVVTDTVEYEIPDFAAPFWIGRGSGYAFNGWMDEFRISKGVARWREDFTPPEREYPLDPYFIDEYTKLLLHCDGPDAGTGFIDTGPSAHAMTAVGNAQIDTDQKKFGVSSGKFDGTGDYLTTPDHADWYMGTSPFTIDWWARPSAVNDTHGFFSQRVSGDNEVFCDFDWASNHFRFTITVGGDDKVVMEASIPYTANNWYHLAVIRGWGGESNKWALCYNGTAVKVLESDEAWPDLDALFRIGVAYSGEMQGWIDEFRVTKGIARWIEDFTPPTLAYPWGQQAAPYEISSPYTEEDLALLNFAQTDRYLYIVHPLYPPYRLTRTDHNAWTLSQITFIDGPYEDEINTPTINPSGTTGSITLTASAALFYPGHVGAFWRIKHTTDWGYVKITGYTDSTHVDADVIEDLDGSGSAAVAHREGSWSDLNGWPRVVCFHEGRLLFASSYEWPQTIWGSKTYKYHNFTPGVNADDPYTFTISEVNVIRWIAASRRLIIGAIDGEATAVGSDENPITATSPPRFRTETFHGSGFLDVLRAGRALVFLQRSEKKLKELIYTYESDTYSSPDLSIIADHLFSSSIVALTYQQEPNSVIWALRSDGILLGCTHERLEGVVGWHRHVTNGLVKSIATIHYNGADQLWAVVERVIDGKTEKFVEFIDPDINVDSGLTYSGNETTSFSGLGHLAGETVAIVGDGAVYPSQVVPSSGIITISPGASEIYTGLAFTPKLITNRPEIRTAGTSQVLKKRWNAITVRIIETSGIKINGQIVPARIIGESGDSMDAAPAPFSGDVEVENLGWDKDGRVTIEQPLPLPVNVTCIMGTVVVGDD